MKYYVCGDCDYCKIDRMNEQGKIRCTRFSRFVNSYDMACQDFHRKVFNTEELRKLLDSLERR